MTQRDMIYAFCRMGIYGHHFWLGAIEKAERVNGMTYNGKNWIFITARMGGCSMCMSFPPRMKLVTSCTPGLSGALNWKNRIHNDDAKGEVKSEDV